jgi:hypothetical protein
VPNAAIKQAGLKFSNTAQDDSFLMTQKTSPELTKKAGAVFSREQ